MDGMERMAWFVVAVAVATGVGSAQELSPTAKLAIEMFDNDNFAKALTYLEDALAETPNNPVLFEYQGRAFLECGGGSINSAQCLQKAEEAMNKAIELGGRATFTVDRSLERGGLFSNTNVLNVKRGLLHIDRNQVSFVPNRQDAKNPPIVIAKAELKNAELNSRNGSSTNVFRIEDRKDTFNFRTANFSAEEAQIVFRLLQKHLGLSVKQKK
jgi:hypothetical protein